MINLHLHPGDDDDDIEYRKKEVELLLAAIEKKLSNKRFWNDNLVIVGDMNLYYATANNLKDNPTVQLFYDKKFKEIESLKGKDTNASKTEAYDRMFLTDNEYFKIEKDSNNKEIGNVFDPFKYVYKDGQEKRYKKNMEDVYGGSGDLDDDDTLAGYYINYWRKNQVSDHFPIWTELIIDSSDDFLKSKLEDF